jgi:uncharacterized protein DUF6064
MQLPFTVAQFLAVFRDYNETVWPVQVILLGLAAVAVLLVVFPRRWSGAAVSAILAGLWLWVGIAYHFWFFTRINPLAYFFAMLSIAGGLAFAWFGIARRRVEFRLQRNARSAAGCALVVFALAIYPAWAVLSGHRFPELPTFGLPCPLTLFTIGILGCAVRPLPRGVLVAPLAWSVVGAQGAFLLDVPPDLSLIVAAAFAVFLLVGSNRHIGNDRLQQA